MQLPPDVLLQQRMRRWAGYLVYIIGAIAVLVLIGWNFDIPILKSVSSNTVAMNPTSAILLILASLSFIWRTRPKGSSLTATAGYAFAILVILVSFIVLINFVIDTGFRPDELLFTGKENNRPNHMAPNTALCFLLTGVGILLLHYENKSGRMAAHYLALIIGSLSLLSLLGYLYQVKEFYGVFNYLAMALNTAICFFLFAAAILFSNPDAGLMKEFTTSLNG
ncbi:MAG: hypothetical protein J7527_11895, partial [Chitinophagaceae bacterium]|nr:hypothetical protein [Chitinophagaceae bacterium]